MSGDGLGTVRPLPGSGLVARVEGLLLVCDAAETVAADLLAALHDTAASGGDGRALARRVAQVLAVMMGEPVACAVAGSVGDGVAVLVSGPASAAVTGPGGEVRLAGRDALTWSDRLVPGPVTGIELRLPEAGPAHPLARLDGGVVVGGGILCDPAGAGAPPAARSAVPRQAEAPATEAPPPAPYPMGPPDPAPPIPVPPPPRPEQQAWHPEPGPQVPPQQGPVSGPIPAVAPRETDTLEPTGAMEAAGTGGEPAGPRERPFEPESRERQFASEPPAQGGPQAAPEPEAAPAAQPLVYGVDCKNDHFNDPRVPYCAVCGIALVQRSLAPYQGPRPPLGVLLLDDGMTLRLDADHLVGRDPDRAPEVADGSVRPAKVTSPDGSVSRRHLRVALDGWDVNLIDLGSVNGTQIQPPGDPNFYDIPPNEPVTIMPGTTVRIGVSRTMRYESHRNR
ncbi:FHA domain-containing protein [Streptosporangium sandarakinum]|uniref:FHA domain-containing protein n=1 Tax=Streptosporangium sandarakinum TaxID=1260955 RepID=A0A852VAB0_9ACTN|nr:FHA domain-containing protein [Streptosporangium sandarakinum]NYF44183.1 hypothetical protein [Streptosporangium sandarakinum]